MRRRATVVLTVALISGCGPAPQSGTDVGASSPPAAIQSAVGFDVGPIRSASDYLQDPIYASADIERGELLSLACVACHTLQVGQDNGLGPNLGGLFGAAAAQRTGFDYSPALVDVGLVWTPLALDGWLAAPASFVPGTSMVFAGYSAPQDRRDLIAYLLHATQISSD